jgi:Flp pilus assembly protein TadD
VRREDRERVLISLAMLAERAGEPEKALGFAQEVLALNPDSPEALNFIGYTWAEQGKNLKESEEMVRRALLYKPDSGYVTDSLGWVYHQQGHYEKALQTLQRADRLAPDEPEIHEHLAETLLKLNRVTEARERLKRALGFKPEERVRKRIEKRLRDLEAKP